MKIISSNVGGWGRAKCSLVNDTISQESPHVVILVETKRMRYCWSLIKNLWRNRRVEWAGPECEGAFRGILIIWDSWLILVVEVIRGQFSISVLFCSEDSEDRWISGVFGLLRPRGGGLFGMN